jgi:hypothetical protein
MAQISGAPNYAANTYQQYGGGLAGSLAATNYNPQMNVAGGQFMMGQAPGMYASGNRLMDMGVDPQHAYYTQAFDQNQQQTRA